MKTRWTFGALLMAALLALAAVLAQETKEAEAEKEKDKVDLKTIQCPMSNGPINAEQFVEFMGAKVYFCCEKCPVAFKKDPKNEKIAAKVRYQIAATKQAKQQLCPFALEELNPETAIQVGYAKVPVAFCCESCQTKANATAEKDKSEGQDALVALIFGNEENFVKAFKIGDEDDDEEHKNDDDDDATS